MKNAPKIALGTWSWGTGMAGGDQVFGNILSTEQLKAVYEEARKYGLNLWDTAAVYGMGSSESILGAVIKSTPRSELLLSTKFTPQIAPDSANPVADLLQESLTRLGTDYIDVYWIHNPADVQKWTTALVPVLKSGVVKSIGVSNHNLEELKLAQSILAKEGFKVSAVQNHYSLLYRSSEDAGILKYCRENSIDFYAYMVLEQGALSGKYGRANLLPAGSGRAETYNKLLPQLEILTTAMAEIGKSKGASVAQIAIAWAIAKGTLPIIGVTKVSQVDDAEKASKLSISAEEIKIIEALADGIGVDTRGAWEKSMV